VKDNQIDCADHVEDVNGDADDFAGHCGEDEEVADEVHLIHSPRPLLTESETIYLNYLNMIVTLVSLK
jgi:hypothetical protein